MTSSATRLPSLFISHGAPNMALTENEAREFMSHLARRYPKPKAIVICSAHFETSGPAVVTNQNPGMIYDFGGFERELYEITYPAPGEPGLAERVASKIEAAGLPVQRLPDRGYDHGTWVPLSLIYPDADVPVVQVSIDPNETPQYHYKLGMALSELAEENILLVGSGNITHNLEVFFSRGDTKDLAERMPVLVDEFVDWMDQKMSAGEIDALLDYRAQAPHAVENHPTDDHLLPLYFSIGTAGNGFTAEKIHDSTQFGFLAMDAYEFRQPAAS